MLVLTLKQTYFLFRSRWYKELWLVDTVKKTCAFPKCKAHVAQYNLHSECTHHRICVSIATARFDSAKCLVCPKMLAKEKKVIGHLGACVNSAQDLKWGRIMSNITRMLRHEGAAPSLTKEDVVSTEDSGTWGILKALNLAAKKQSVSIEARLRVDNPIGNIDHGTPVNTSSSLAGKIRQVLVPQEHRRC